MYQVNTLYTLNLHNVICQLYLSKAGKNGGNNSNYLPLSHSYCDDDNEAMTSIMEYNILSEWQLLTTPTAISVISPEICKHLGNVI